MINLEKVSSIIKELEDKGSKSVGGPIEYGQSCGDSSMGEYNLISSYDNVLKSKYLGTLVDENEAIYVQALYDNVPELLAMCKELYKMVMQNRECMFRRCHFKPDDWMFRDGYCMGENSGFMEGKEYECQKCSLFRVDK